MTERPIIFSQAMVLALMEGRKSQTRRRAWVSLARREGEIGPVRIRPSIWQHVKPGDRLWVREGWYTWGISDDLPPRQLTGREGLGYLADQREEQAGKSRLAIHMPRWAARLMLTVTANRVHRVQEITGDEAFAEGLPSRAAFAGLWSELHGGRAWIDNPEVIAMTFTVEKIRGIGR